MKKINYLTLLSVVMFSFIQLAFAHGGLDEMNTLQMKKFQQKMIAEKFLNPKDVKELGRLDMFTEKAYDRSMYCKNNPQMFENNCARLKYDYVEPVATPTENIKVAEPEAMSIFSEYLTEIILLTISIVGMFGLYFFRKK